MKTNIFIIIVGLFLALTALWLWSFWFHEVPLTDWRSVPIFFTSIITGIIGAAIAFNGLMRIAADNDET